MSPAELPDWLRPLVAALSAPRPEPAAAPGRAAAVLLLLGPDRDLLLIERARTLRKHAGQAALPGGAIDPQDAGPVAAALREAEEEVGVKAVGVRILGLLAPRRISVSGYAVTPVIGYWQQPVAVRAVDPAEVAAVRRVPIAQFLDPRRRFHAHHPSGAIGPAFRLDDLVVWGFTAGVIDQVLTLAGWAEPLTPQTSAGVLRVGP